MKKLKKQARKGLRPISASQNFLGPKITKHTYIFFNFFKYECRFLWGFFWGILHFCKIEIGDFRIFVLRFFFFFHFDLGHFRNLLISTPYNFIAKINFQMTRKVKGKARKIVTKKEKAKKTAMMKVRCFHEFFNQLQRTPPRTARISGLKS